MSSYQYDYLVFIGRFEPFHIGHQEVVARALELAERVIILVGSSNQPRTIKNPWTFLDRKHMIESVFPVETDFDVVRYGRRERISILPLRDFKSDNNVWAANVQRIVADCVQSTFGWSDMPRKGGIIGHEKDESSFYLKLFPQWPIVDHNMNEVVHATDIRKLYFESNIKYLASVVSEPVYQFLEQFKKRNEYQILLEEWEFIKKYKKAWEAAPYAPTFLTCDAVVVQSGFILLIERKAAPGKGLWALPGGFVNQNETIRDAVIRELKEETKIKVPSKVLIGCIEKDQVFDAPDRSLRGRTVTQAFYIKLPAGDLPVVKGSDDAKQARWVPLSEVKEEEMFEDHMSIIQHFVGKF